MSVAKHLSNYPALNAYIESLRPIPAGTFQMGCASGYIIEKPVHSVTLSAFRMGATPVTVAVWKEFCAATKTPLPDAPSWGLLDDHPIVNVSWNDIMGTDGNGGFCAWASDVAGFRLTLPTEAQFEYASCGGQDGVAYPWGDTFDATKVWCSGIDAGDAGKTAPVIRSSNIYRNAYGLTDMAGNVYQWCFDLYAPYDAAAQTDPIGPKSTPSNGHCLRGGTWKYNNPGYFRCTSRDRGGADVAINIYGFRLAAGMG
jgi:formylglycine-generating enzyme required for sulfatase activity